MYTYTHTRAHTCAQVHAFAACVHHGPFQLPWPLSHASPCGEPEHKSQVLINQHMDSLPAVLLVLSAGDESSSLDQPETPIASNHNGATELCSLRRHQEGPWSSWAAKEGQNPGEDATDYWGKQRLWSRSHVPACSVA